MTGVKRERKWSGRLDRAAL